MLIIAKLRENPRKISNSALSLAGLKFPAFPSLGARNRGGPHQRPRLARSPKEVDMHEHFNNASLANLSKPDLEALLANYLAKLNATDNEAEKAQVRSDIAIIQKYLFNLS